MVQSARKMAQLRLASLARGAMTMMAMALTHFLLHARLERNAQDQLQDRSAIAHLEASPWLEHNSAQYVLLANTVQMLTTLVSTVQGATTRTSQDSRLALFVQLAPHVQVYPKDPQNANMELIRQFRA